MSNPPEDAITLLLDRTDRLVTALTGAERQTAEQLARELGYFPLALE